MPLSINSMPLFAALAKCDITETDYEGPFYEQNAPVRNKTGSGFILSGSVLSSADCSLLPGARIEWWSTNVRGKYVDSHRATQFSDSAGKYRYETDYPGHYGRPRHIHVRVTASNHETLITQIYPEIGEKYLKFDFVLTAD